MYVLEMALLKFIQNLSRSELALFSQELSLALTFLFGNPKVFEKLNKIKL